MFAGPQFEEQVRSVRINPPKPGPFSNLLEQAGQDEELFEIARDAIIESLRNDIMSSKEKMSTLDKHAIDAIARQESVLRAVEKRENVKFYIDEGDEIIIPGSPKDNTWQVRMNISFY